MLVGLRKNLTRRWRRPEMKMMRERMMMMMRRLGEKEVLERFGERDWGGGGDRD